MENRVNKSLVGIIVFLLAILCFIVGIFVGQGKEASLTQDSERIMLKIPKTRRELEKQYLLNKAQYQILEQMLKWDMYKEEKK